MAGKGDILSLPEGVGLKAKERLVVLFTWGVGKSPGTVPGVDEVSFIRTLFSPEPLDCVSLLVGPPGLNVDMIFRTQWHDKLLPVLGAALGKLRGLCKFQADIFQRHVVMSS